MQKYEKKSYLSNNQIEKKSKMIFILFKAYFYKYNKLSTMIAEIYISIHILSVHCIVCPTYSERFGRNTPVTVSLF